MSLFREDDVEHHLEVAPESGSRTYAKLFCIASGLLAAFLFGLEVVIVMELGLMNVDGDKAGIYYAFFVGMAGLISLLGLLMTGELPTHLYTPSDYGLICAGGFVETFGMILTVYAASIGVGGIAFALANTCCIYVALFNYLVMRQALTPLEVLGIVLTLGGASVIAAQEQISRLIFKT